MTHEEIRLALAAVHLAINDRLAEGEGLEVWNVRPLAYNFGERTATPQHIDSVLDCIDLEGLASLIEWPK